VHPIRGIYIYIYIYIALFSTLPPDLHFSAPHLTLFCLPRTVPRASTARRNTVTSRSCGFCLTGAPTSTRRSRSGLAVAPPTPARVPARTCACTHARLDEILILGGGMALIPSASLPHPLCSPLLPPFKAGVAQLIYESTRLFRTESRDRTHDTTCRGLVALPTNDPLPSLAPPTTLHPLLAKIPFRPSSLSCALRIPQI
jgi:hypothetical protein